ncbi:unnamed protein product [Colias eurytheme]|nr:unnamed protein product [Colias eurytheme]
MPKRCALGCSYNALISYHQFPHPEKNPDRFKAWVQIVGGQLDSQEDYELYKKKVICDIHFIEKDKNRNNRLNFLAVPSLHLQGNVDIASLTEILPTSDPIHNQPSSTKLTEIVPDKSGEIVTYEKVLLVPDVDNESIGLSTVRPTVTGEIHTSETAFLPPESLNESCVGIISSEHNYHQLQKKPIKVKHHQQLEPPSLLLNQLNTTRSKVKSLQSKLFRSLKQNKKFESRLADSEKMSTNVLLNKITNKMTAAAKIFTRMQYTQTSKKPSGRRFNLEEKLLSLSLYKKSPRCYSLLEKYFTLPSIKSLKRLLTNIEVESGINKV